jgi:glutathione S-transferase
MTLKLYAFPPSPRSFKVLWAAHHLGIEYELQLVDLTKGAQRAPEYVALNPNARAPVLEDDGFVLWESNAIVEYLASLKPESGILPQATRARLGVVKWMYWESAHWDPACAVFVFERIVKPVFGMGDTDARELQRGSQLIERAAKVLDAELQNHRYIVGERFTAADLCVGADLCASEAAQYPLEGYRGIRRWSEEIRALPSWQKTAAMQRPPG